MNACMCSPAGSREQNSTDQRHTVGAGVCAPSIVDADTQMPSAMPIHTCRRRCRCTNAIGDADAFSREKKSVA